MSQEEIRTKKKMTQFEEWMKLDHVLIHLDTRKEGVAVPEFLTPNPSLTLKLSYLFQGETTYDDNAITSYLKFNGDYQKCLLPWAAIWGMTAANEENIVWPEDMPGELVLQLAKAKFKEIGAKIFGKKDEEQMQADTKPGNELKSPSPNLQAVEGAHKENSEPEHSNVIRKPPSLRRVK